MHSFTRTYDHVPTVLITASHSMTEGKTIPEYNSIAAWVEVCRAKKSSLSTGIVIQNEQKFFFFLHCMHISGSKGGRMVSVMDSGSNGPGSSPDRDTALIYSQDTLPS